PTRRPCAARSSWPLPSGHAPDSPRGRGGLHSPQRRRGRREQHLPRCCPPHPTPIRRCSGRGGATSVRSALRPLRLCGGTLAVDQPAPRSPTPRRLFTRRPSISVTSSVSVPAATVSPTRGRRPSWPNTHPPTVV